MAVISVGARRIRDLGSDRGAGPSHLCLGPELRHHPAGEPSWTGSAIAFHDPAADARATVPQRPGQRTSRPPYAHRLAGGLLDFSSGFLHSTLDLIFIDTH